MTLYPRILLPICIALIAAPSYASDVKKGECDTDDAIVKKIKACPVTAAVGTDFTQDAACQGAWLLFSDGTETGAEADNCTADGTDNMTYAGTQSFTLASTTPVGTPADQDAVDFNNAEGFSLADDNKFEANTFTIGCWFLKNVDAADIWYSKEDVANYELESRLTTHNFRSKMVGNFETSAAMALNGWDHLVAQYDTAVGENQIYVNGVQDCVGGCIATTDPVGNTEGLFLGRASGSNRLDGDLMVCPYLNRAMTDTEICEWMLCGFDGLADGTARDAEYGSVGCGCDDITTCC